MTKIRISVWFVMFLIYVVAIVNGLSAAQLNDDSPLKGKKICLDAGHGGVEKGAVGLQGTMEKDVNFKVVQRLAELLRQEGAIIRLCRPDDEQVGIRRRAEINIEFDSDLFVSVHHNANAQMDRTMNRTEVFYHYKDFGGPSEDVTREILRELEASFRLPDSKTYCCWAYGVLRYNKIPAVLVEASYIQNPEEENRLNTPERIEMEAQALFQAIKRFFTKGTPTVEFLSPAEQKPIILLKARITEPDNRSLIDPTSIKVMLDDEPLLYTYDIRTGLLYASYPEPLPAGAHQLTIQAQNLNGSHSPVIKQGLTIRTEEPEWFRYLPYMAFPPEISRSGFKNARMVFNAIDAYGNPYPDTDTLRLSAARVSPLQPAHIKKGRLRLYFTISAVEEEDIIEFKGRDIFQAVIDTEKLGSYGTGMVVKDALTQNYYANFVINEKNSQPIPNAIIFSPTSEVFAIADERGWFGITLPKQEQDFFVQADGFFTTQLKLPPVANKISLTPLFNGVLGGKRIVIDPEFGGDEPGIIAPNGLRASDLNLKAAQFLGDYLRLAGAAPILTRQRDETIDNVARAVFGMRQAADYFITIGHRAPYPGYNEPADLNISRAYWKWDESKKLAQTFAPYMQQLLETEEGNIQHSSTWTIMHAQLQFNAFEVSPLMLTASKTPQRLEHSACLRKEALAILYGFLATEGLNDQKMAEIKGQVVDAVTQKPIANAYILLNNTLPFQTEADGKLSFKFLNPGQYRLTVFALGYKEVEQRVKIEVGEKKEIEITLQAASATQ